MLQTRAKVCNWFPSLIGGGLACVASANMIDWNVVKGDEAVGIDSNISDNIAASPCEVTKG